MRLPLFIAFRYLFGKKSHNAINLISWVSAAGILTGTLALIIVLSVFNGFEEIVKSLYNTFDPDLKIAPLKGKVFSSGEIPKEKIASLHGVADVNEVYEDNALFRYRGQQHIGFLKGVGDGFTRNSGLGEKLLQGDFVLSDSLGSYALVGSGVAWYLNMGLEDAFYPLEVYVPDRTYRPGDLTGEQPFRMEGIKPSGIFSVQQDFDTRYVVVPLAFARDLWKNPEGCTSVEVYFEKGADREFLQEQIQQITGSNFRVANRYQQQETLYKIMKTENLAIFVILSFIILVATFNVTGALSMVIVEKQKDIAVLHSMGATPSLIRRIFMSQGLALSLGAGLAGLALGGLICYLQQTYGFIKLSTTGNSFVVQQYPVAMQWTDFVIVFFIVGGVGTLAAWIPAAKSTKTHPAAFFRTT